MLVGCPFQVDVLVARGKVGTAGPAAAAVRVSDKGAVRAAAVRGAAVRGAAVRGAAGDRQDEGLRVRAVSPPGAALAQQGGGVRVAGQPGSVAAVPGRSRRDRAPATGRREPGLRDSRGSRAARGAVLAGGVPPPRRAVCALVRERTAAVAPGAPRRRGTVVTPARGPLGPFRNPWGRLARARRRGPGRGHPTAQVLWGAGGALGW